MVNFKQKSDDYKKIETAIHYIENHFKSQPDLEAIARSVHLSKYHFNRLFKRWAGITPIQFLQFMTLDFTKQQLAASQSVLDTSLEAGLSGPGRLHDLYVTIDAMTPGEFKKKAAGIGIEYGFGVTPFGRCLAAKTQRGLCHFSFTHDDNTDQALLDLTNRWPDARFKENGNWTQSIVQDIFRSESSGSRRPFHLDLKGTNFQIKVWQALLNIPKSHLVCYQDIARYIGNPKAVRAVASAISFNPVAFLIPCHRVIAKSGKTHLYRWGAERKKAMIGWEAALKNSQTG